MVDRIYKPTPECVEPSFCNVTPLADKRLVLDRVRAAETPLRENSLA